MVFSPRRQVRESINLDFDLLRYLEEAALSSGRGVKVFSGASESFQASVSDRLAAACHSPPRTLVTLGLKQHLTATSGYITKQMSFVSHLAACTPSPANHGGPGASLARAGTWTFPRSAPHWFLG